MAETESKLENSWYRMAVKTERGGEITPVPVKFPKSWQGATPEQLRNSAKAVLGQQEIMSQLTGETWKGDRRCEAARWVRENL